MGCSTKTLRLILKKFKIKQLFSTMVRDPRRGLCTYSLTSLLFTALLTHLFRLPSKNSFYDEAKISQLFSINVAKAIDAPSLPSPKTIEDAFLQINPSELIAILPAIFKKLIKSKFFEIHPEYLTQDRFSISIDAVTTHNYHPYSQHPTAACLYCLKRTHGGSCYFLHSEVILTVIGPNNFLLPLFIYRIKGTPAWENLSPEKLKQECELTALPHLLAQFRNYFPRLNCDLLLDSLYANQTVMTLAEQYNFNYAIVRKSCSMKSLNDEAAGLKKLQKPFRHTSIKGRWTVQQTTYLFDHLVHHGHSFQLLELQEHATKLPSRRFAKVTEKSSHWQWMIRNAVNKSDAFLMIDRARSRWYHENFHNTIKNRGFACQHDMSRAPTSQTIWKFLMLIAYTISKLMELSQLGHLARRGAAICNWFRDLWAEFAKLPPALLWETPLPEQLRYFFDTS